VPTNPITGRNCGEQSSPSGGSVGAGVRVPKSSPVVEHDDQTGVRSAMLPWPSSTTLPPGAPTVMADRPKLLKNDENASTFTNGPNAPSPVGPRAETQTTCGASQYAEKALPS
jgi:hypothetical protein